MLRELAAQRALDEGFFEAADRDVQLLGREWSLPHELVENPRRNGRQRCVAHQGLTTKSGHNGSSCYAPTHKIPDRLMDSFRHVTIGTAECVSLLGRCLSVSVAVKHV